ncbi:MAG: glycosyltransferase family 39 protein [Actinobacteria bacterium]|nr:glycosyltransferase family 39 protein [Actinomycetota bacterium]
MLGLVAAGVALRFSTLDLQSFWADEAATVGRVLRPSLWSTLGQVGSSEATPPLYYVLAWGWTRLLGHSEAGIRSLSALFGTATVPVAWWSARLLISRAAGVAAAALVAVSPTMVWYSQEARAYALLILLSAAGLAFFAQAVRTREPRAVGWWAVASALAVLAHYFAVFTIAPEAVVLAVVLTERRRQVAVAAGAVLAVCAALVPLAVHQVNQGHDVWISTIPFRTRLDLLVKQFVFGYNGSSSTAMSVIVLGSLAGVAALAAMGLRRAPDWRWWLPLMVGAVTIGVPIAVKVFGHDFFFPRNVIAAWVPLAVAASVAVAVPRAGAFALAALCAAFLAMTIAIDATPRLQRFDWRSAAKAIGPARVPRLVVGPDTGANPLAYYLPHAREVRRGAVAVAEVDLAWFAAAPGRRPPVLPRPFRAAGSRARAGLLIRRYAAPGGRPVRLDWRRDVRFAVPGARAILELPR